MGARELVMAVLCRPLSGKDLLLAEKANNVIIHRKIEYTPRSDKRAIDDFIQSVRWLPVKLMFIFATGDAIIINSTDDMTEVANRLMAV